MIFKHTAYADKTKNADFYTDYSIQEGSSTTNINKNISYNYASLEYDSYDIDNPRLLYTGEGLALSTTTQSNAYGEFSTPIQITANIGSVVDFSGISIDTDCIITSAKISTYNADELIAEKEFTNTDSANYFRTDSKEISKVVIQINSINTPYRFLDIFNINFGRVFMFGEESIKEPKMINQFSVSGRELPIDSLEFTLFNIPDDLVLDNNQKLDVIDKNGIVKFTFYVNSWEYDENREKVKITYNDVVSLLEDEYPGMFNDDVYNYDEASKTYTKLEEKLSSNFTHVFYSTVKDVVNDILDGTGVVCSFEEGVADTEVRGAIPTTTRRNALIYVANATGYKFIKQPNLKLIKQSNNVIKSFDETNIFRGTQKTTLKKPCKKVTMNLYKFVCNIDNEENYERVYYEKLPAGEHTIRLNKSTHPYLVQIQGSFDTISRKNNVYSNKSQFITTSDGFVEVYVVKYEQKIDNYISKEISNAELYPNYSDITIDSFTLMGDDEKRLNELLEYYSSTEEISAKVLWLNPQIGAMVNFEGKNKTVRKISTNFTDAVEIEVE